MVTVRITDVPLRQAAEMDAIMARLRAAIAQLAPGHEQWAAELLAFLDSDGTDRAYLNRDWPHGDWPQPEWPHCAWPDHDHPLVIRRVA